MSNYTVVMVRRTFFKDFILQTFGSVKLRIKSGNLKSKHFHISFYEVKKDNLFNLLFLFDQIKTNQNQSYINKKSIEKNTFTSKILLLKRFLINYVEPLAF